MDVFENAELDDDAHRFLSAILYATQFSESLHSELDRIMIRLVLPKIQSGKMANQWVLDLMVWCQNNRGWREHLLATKFDEQEMMQFLSEIAAQLVLPKT